MLVLLVLVLVFVFVLVLVLILVLVPVLVLVEYGHEAEPSILGLEIVLLAARRDDDYGDCYYRARQELYLLTFLANTSGIYNCLHFWKL